MFLISLLRGFLLGLSKSNLPITNINIIPSNISTMVENAPPIVIMVYASLNNTKSYIK